MPHVLSPLPPLMPPFHTPPPLPPPIILPLLPRKTRKHNPAPGPVPRRWSPAPGPWAPPPLLRLHRENNFALYRRVVGLPGLAKDLLHTSTKRFPSKKNFFISISFLFFLFLFLFFLVECARSLMTDSRQWLPGWITVFISFLSFITGCAKSSALLHTTVWGHMTLYHHSHSQVQTDSVLISLGCGGEAYMIWYDIIWLHMVVCKSADNFAHPVIDKNIHFLLCKSKFCSSLNLFRSKEWEKKCADRPKWIKIDKNRPIMINRK